MKKTQLSPEFIAINIALLTISDSRRIENDKSGNLLQERISSIGHNLKVRNIIKDDFQLGHRYLPIERFEQDFNQYEILDGDILVTMMGTTGKSKVFSSSYERGILDSHLINCTYIRIEYSSNVSDLFFQ